MSLPSCWPLEFTIIAKCKWTKARTSRMALPNFACSTPMFMPVATQAVMKGLTTKQLINLDCHLILNNTYHLALTPGKELLEFYGGAHKFMNWTRAMLTDRFVFTTYQSSGGFQMVSLAKLMKVTEHGVTFNSHIDGTEMSLTPEESIHVQNAIGADIIMQLDDVVSSITTGPRVEEAMWRSIRWLDRCLLAHHTNTTKAHSQNVFAIIQGGLDLSLRRQCVEEMVKRDCPGYAIGGLSGGEQKDTFWRIVSYCTDLLPRNKPIYCMGVGYAEDLVVCSALGVDMYDCVFPTRTAKKVFENDGDPIESDCLCETCLNYTRSEIYTLFVNGNTTACQLVSIHNIAFQMRLMSDIRCSIEENRFPCFVKSFMYTFYKERIDKSHGGSRFGGESQILNIEQDADPGKAFTEKGYPIWVTNALESVGIALA